MALIHDNQKLEERYTDEDISWFYKANKEFEEIEKYNNYNGYIPDYFQDYNTKYIFDNNESVYIPHREAIEKQMKKFKDFYCCQGVNSLSIDTQGNYRGAECSIAPIIGNIYKDNIDYFNLIKPIKCSLEGCACRINNYAPKYIDSNKAQKYINMLDFSSKDIIKNKVEKLQNQIILVNLNPIKYFYLKNFVMD